MKGALITLAFFICGILVSINGIVHDFFLENDLSSYALYVLMTLVGISLGMDKSALNILKKVNIGLLLVPVSIAIGSVIGAGIAYCIISEPFREGMAVGAGFGYYSLSSIIISNNYDPILGVIALLSNIIRELFSLVAAPILVKLFGKLSPIASAGATSMDTTLPIISQYSGKDYVVVSLFSGIILTILVPILIPLIL
ncbi:MAG: lysine exporter LysO family protein [Mangrovibacterium sp.]